MFLTVIFQNKAIQYYTESYGQIVEIFQHNSLVPQAFLIYYPAVIANILFLVIIIVSILFTVIIRKRKIKEVTTKIVLTTLFSLSVVATFILSISEFSYSSFIDICKVLKTLSNENLKKFDFTKLLNYYENNKFG